MTSKLPWKRFPIFFQIMFQIYVPDQQIQRKEPT
jgi:hypothetical protein